MRHAFRALVGGCMVALALALAGCAQGPTFGEVAAGVPAPPQGQARIFVYRWLEPYVSTQWTTVYFNGLAVGNSGPGTVFYRDVPPGRYFISVRSVGLYPNQFKTVVVAPGDTVYARVETLDTWATTRRGYFDTYVVSIIDPGRGRAEIEGLRYGPG